MAFGETKVYFDGSHYIAIPHTTRPSKKRPKPVEELITVTDEVEETTDEESTPSNIEDVPFLDFETTNDNEEIDDEQPVENKVVKTKELLEQHFETKVISHRSGRWALNENYLRVLEKCGIEIDCSVVPQTSFYALAGRSVAHGSDYTKASKVPSYLYRNIFEVPMTARKIHKLGVGSFKHRIKNLLLGENCWLRPLQMDAQTLKYLTEYVEREGETDYVEFMIHSSELLLGANPYFQTEEELEKLFVCMEEYFSFLQAKGYVGVTLKEYKEQKDKL